MRAIAWSEQIHGEKCGLAPRPAAALMRTRGGLALSEHGPMDPHPGNWVSRQDAKAHRAFTTKGMKAVIHLGRRGRP